jgi:hypothetical protein
VQLISFVIALDVLLIVLPLKNDVGGAIANESTVVAVIVVDVDNVVLVVVVLVVVLIVLVVVLAVVVPS